MPDRNQEQTERNYAREAGPQPDPALHEGRSTAARTWIVTGLIAAMVLAVMYGIVGHRESGDSTPQITGAESQPPSQSGGRGTSDAPPNPAITSPPRSGG